MASYGPGSVEAQLQLAGSGQYGVRVAGYSSDEETWLGAVDAVARTRKGAVPGPTRPEGGGRTSSGGGSVVAQALLLGHSW